MERWEVFQGVYVHTPFCLQKCLYCDFPSYSGFPEEVRQQYVEALCREIEIRSRQRDLPVAEGATVYFGGGTPTVLSEEQIGQIVGCLKRNGFWKKPAEATIEANPGTVNPEKLKTLRELGFDRISIGVQSLQDKELRALGRIHTAEQALRAVEEAKQAGFQRINADLMSGIPCQTVESFCNTLDAMLRMNLSHLSVYSLILEEGTPLERLVEKGNVSLPDEETSYSMYEMTRSRLEQAGLKRYEISNYAVPGEESLHNKVYWHYEPYAAFGVGACTFTGNERRTNTIDVREYINAWSAVIVALQSKESATFEKNISAAGSDCTLWETETLDRKTQISEAMIMALRMTEGVDLNIMQRRFGADISKYYEREIQMLLDKKMAEREAGVLRLTPYGMRYGNRAFEAFV
ncbi:MAG: radical SAM family heme chaperone HemW [Acidaminococcaceae bacterium]|nr:radical SAM family heme chaperone HemW [Acidaminococcaceae bacterium]